MGNMNIKRNKINVEEKFNDLEYLCHQSQIEYLRYEIENKKKTLGLISRYYFDDRVIENLLKIKQRFEELGIEEDDFDYMNKKKFVPKIISHDDNTENKIPVTQEFDPDLCIGKFIYHYKIIGGYDQYFWSCCGDESKNHDPVASHPLEIGVWLQAIQQKIIKET
jgi:hypothetical protein